LDRGGRVEVNAGRIESFEGAPARNHGPWDRRGVIVDADDDDVDLELGVSAVRPAACPRPAHPKPPYRLQPLFCVNISHYLKYVRSKFAGLSYERGRATVISYFGVRPLARARPAAQTW